MAIHKRPDSPYWWYSFKLPGQSRINASTRTPDRKLALKIYYKALNEGNENKIFKRPTKMTVNKLLDWCFDHYWKESSYADHFIHRLKNIRDYFGNKQADSVTIEDILKYRSKRLAEKKAKSTINRDLTYLRSAFNNAMDNNLLFENPVERIKFFDESDRKRDRFLNKAEKDKLLSNSKGILHQLIFFALKTGMRQGEILNLKWKDIQLDNGHMRVISRKGNKITIRYVPIFDQIYALLTSFSKSGAHVFSYPQGGRLSRFGVVHSPYIKLLKRLGIDDFTFHDLRHTFASDFLSKGGTLNELAKIMGHSATRMTERYGHLSKEHLVAAIKVLPHEECYAEVTLPNSRPSKISKVLESQLSPR